MIETLREAGITTLAMQEMQLFCRYLNCEPAIAITALILWLTASAETVEALRISSTIGDNENVVFFDDFESVPSGSVPAAFIGTWSQNNSPDVVADGSISGDPVAFQGSNYLRIVRPQESENWAEFDGGLIQSGTLTAEFMLYMPGSAPAAALNLTILEEPQDQFTFPGGFSANLANLDFINGVAPLRTIVTVDPVTTLSTNAMIQADTWQLWKIDIDIDNKTYEVNIGETSTGTLDWMKDANDQFYASGVGVIDFRGGSETPPSLVYLDALDVPSGPDRTWGTDSFGNWQTGGNWLGGPAPNANNENAIFGDVISRPRTVFTDNDVTVNSLRFENENRYVIGGSGRVVLDAEAGAADITVVGVGASDSHEFQSRVLLADPTTVNVDPGALLVLNNTLDLGGNTLTVHGDLRINNNQNTLSDGTIDLMTGTLSGSGRINGNLISQGLISPGESSGSPTMVDHVVQGSGQSTVVPEPSTFILIATAVLGFLLRRRCARQWQYRSRKETTCGDSGDLAYFVRLRRCHNCLLPFFISMASVLTAISTAQAVITTDRVATGLSQPVYVTAPPEDNDRLFIVEQQGLIKILDLNTGMINPMPFLDLTGDIFYTVDEGLFGLAFHPDYANNGKFYIEVSDDPFEGGTHHATYIRQYTVSAGDLNLADPASETTILRYSQPLGEHNGGWIGFNPQVNPTDPQYLHIVTGDDGGGVPPNHAQTLTNDLLGKVLRIDVDGDDFTGASDPGNVRNYAIPPDNPYVGVAGDDEIWAYGLRNAWRNSFDRQTGDFYTADVGNDQREEVNFQPAGSSGGQNYGWNVMEGNFCFNPSPQNPPCFDPGFTDPILDYDHNGQNASVTGGYVYRGPISQLQGQYVFGDFRTFEIWSFQYDGNTIQNFTDRTAQFQPPPGEGSIDWIVSFGEDADGDLYIVDYLDGEVFQVVETFSPLHEWNIDGPGLWTALGNWAPLGWPDSNETAALFGGAVSSNSTVVLDSDVTVNSVRFNNAATYVISGSGAVNLQSDAGNASLHVDLGTHEFQVPVEVLSQSDVNISSGATLQFNNRLSLNGNLLMKSGDGELQINNVLDAEGGMISGQAGTISGTGNVAGDLSNVGAVVAPGNSPGVLAVGGDYIQFDGGTLLIEIGGLEKGAEHDLLDVAGDMVIHGGTLEISLVGQFVPDFGQRFDILDFTSLDGGFDLVRLPPISSDLAWDLSALSATGVLSVTTVPEPLGIVVLVWGVLSLQLWHRLVR